MLFISSFNIGPPGLLGTVTRSAVSCVGESWHTWEHKGKYININSFGVRKTWNQLLKSNENSWA